MEPDSGGVQTTDSRMEEYILAVHSRMERCSSILRKWNKGGRREAGGADRLQQEKPMMVVSSQLMMMMMMRQLMMIGQLVQQIQQQEIQLMMMEIQQMKIQQLETLPQKMVSHPILLIGNLISSLEIKWYMSLELGGGATWYERRCMV